MFLGEVTKRRFGRGKVRGQAVIFFGAAIVAGFGYGAQGKGTGSIFSYIYGESDPTDIIRHLATEDPSLHDPLGGAVTKSVVHRLGTVDQQFLAEGRAAFSQQEVSQSPPTQMSRDGASPSGGARSSQSQNGEIARLREESGSLKSQEQQANSHLAQNQVRLQERRTADQQQNDHQQKLLNERIELLEKSQHRIRGENDELKAKIASQERELSVLRSSQSEGGKARESSLMQIASLERENTTLRRQVEQTRGELLGAEEQNRGALGRLEANVRELEETRKSLLALSDRTAQLERELKEARGEREEFAKKANSKLDDKQKREKEVTRITAELEEAKKALQERDQQLAEARQFEERSNQCLDQLLRSKNELVLARTELSTLTAVVTRPVRGSTNQGGTAVSRSVPRGGAVMAHEPPMKSDVMIVQVVVPKANLRSGPGEEHSSVMEIAGGSRLTVEERMGDWYRVLTPTGSRAYVRQDLVTSADGPGVVSIVSPPSTVVAPPRRVAPPQPAPPPPLPPSVPSPVKAVMTAEKNLDTKAPEELITRTDDDSIGFGAGAPQVKSGEAVGISEQELTTPPLEEEEKRALEILQRGIATGVK